MLVKEVTPTDRAAESVLFPELQEPNALIRYAETQVPLDVDAIPPTDHPFPLPVVVPPMTFIPKGNSSASSAATAVVFGVDGGTYQENSDPKKMSLAGKDNEPTDDVPIPADFGPPRSTVNQTELREKLKAFFPKLSDAQIAERSSRLLVNDPSLKFLPEALDILQKAVDSLDDGDEMRKLYQRLGLSDEAFAQVVDEPDYTLPLRFAQLFEDDDYTLMSKLPILYFPRLHGTLSQLFPALSDKQINELFILIAAQTLSATLKFKVLVDAIEMIREANEASSGSIRQASPAMAPSSSAHGGSADPMIAAGKDGRGEEVADGIIDLGQVRAEKRDIERWFSEMEPGISADEQSPTIATYEQSGRVIRCIGLREHFSRSAIKALGDLLSRQGVPGLFIIEGLGEKIPEVQYASKKAQEMNVPALDVIVTPYNRVIAELAGVTIKDAVTTIILAEVRRYEDMNILYNHISRNFGVTVGSVSLLAKSLSKMRREDFDKEKTRSQETFVKLTKVANDISWNLFQQSLQKSKPEGHIVAMVGGAHAEIFSPDYKPDRTYAPEELRRITNRIKLYESGVGNTASPPDPVNSILILLGNEESFQQIGNTVSPSDREKVPSTRRKPNLADALKENQALKAALRERGLTEAQQTDLFNHIAKTTKYYTDMPETISLVLPAVLDAGLELEQIPLVFGRITEEGGFAAERALEALPGALEVGHNPEEFVSLLHRIKEKNLSAETGTFLYFGKAFEALPAAFKARLSLKEIETLFDYIAEETGNDAYYAFDALPAVLETAGETPETVLAHVLKKLYPEAE